MGCFFPARRVLLLPDEQTQTVSSVYFSQGMNYIAAQNWTDPHVTYRFHDEGRFAWRPNQERPVWRNLDTLLRNDKKSRPRTLEQFTALRPEKRYASVTLYGVQTDRSRYVDIMRYDLEIPTAALRHPYAAALVEACIKLSEELASVLRASLTHEDIPPAVTNEAEQAYYDDCERRMWQMCGEIPADADADPAAACAGMCRGHHAICAAAVCKGDRADLAARRSAGCGDAAPRLADGENTQDQKGVWALQEQQKQLSDAFFTKLDSLPRGDRAALKRAAGSMLSEADGKAMSAFFTAFHTG